MLINVVPVFVKMYKGMGVKVPAPTAAIMAMSDFMRNPFGGGLCLVLFIIFFHIQQQASVKIY